MPCYTKVLTVSINILCSFIHDFILILNNMKNILLSFLILAMCLSGYTALSQSEKDTTLLGLPGDNLNLAAVLDLFQKSKTIEDFEKSLNEQKSGINNLDLNLDEKADFIKVVTKQKDADFSFILQVDVNEKETQDVAVIFVSKDKNGKVSMQIVGDPDLYGKDYVVEPKPPVTANPGYTGNDPVKTSTSTTGTNTTTVVVVESAPVVQYVYSPAYVPYTPPYYYNYYPPYFAAFTIMAVSAYHYNCYHAPYHGGYHGGGYGNTVIINNNNNYNNYNNHRNTSNTVNNNRNNGNYNKNNASNRASAGNTASNRASAGTSASNRASAGTSASTRQSAGASSSNRASSSSYSPSSSSRASSSSSRSNYSSQPSRSSNSYSGGGRSGGYSGGGGRGGGGGGRGGRR
jgi:hypothetical protein